jgi:hypothetical protein
LGGVPPNIGVSTYNFPKFFNRLYDKIILDIDECETGSFHCAVNSECINTVSSYACSCIFGYVHDDLGDCVDFDECSDSFCGKNAECINEIGAYSCMCYPGFSKSETFEGTYDCVDTDECSILPSVCTNAGYGFNFIIKFIYYYFEYYYINLIKLNIT